MGPGDGQTVRVVTVMERTLHLRGDLQTVALRPAPDQLNWSLGRWKLAWKKHEGPRQTGRRGESREAGADPGKG